MKKETLLTHSGRDPFNHSGAVNVPISQTSTILFPSAEEYHNAEKGKSCYPAAQKSGVSDPSYGTSGTPTNFALQDALCALEQGDYCALTSSGLSAITHALSAFLSAGDHLLMVDTAYGPTRRFCHNDLKKYGVEITYYDPHIGKDIASLIQKNTKVIFMESPGSLTFEVQDVPAIVAVAKKHNIVTMIDNSWATPLFFQPLSLGVDISIQAVTKYINGHSDVLMGAIITKGTSASNIIAKEIRYRGACNSAFDCYLALRGLRSLAARMNAHQANTKKVVDWIENIPQVKEIMYPAHKKSPDYALWKKQFTGAASLFSVVLDKKYSQKTLYKFMDSLKFFGIGASWGGYESLVLDFDPKPVRSATQWTEDNSCVRFYIGLESPEDLIIDLEKAFKVLK